MTEILTQVTWGIVGMVVLALVFYLGGVLLALYRAGNHLAELNRLLASVGDNTDPFSNRLETVNGALSQLQGTLVSVNQELKGILQLFAK